ncbi:integrase catalytic domain-containing protein [Trichonephila inaurata madagascariensis]|uniref:Integrase catalytic domain-containing protein n=2 Tax=Trichonephila inaurata madagascariensis TaxID=2747483 RepID=A0A8X6XL73_9ARAC|nr:integrase catalytic domain-containing protein [Trichonephila inaurata madagascariensis]
MKNDASGRTKTDLPALYDELEGKLWSLESLGRTQEKYGDFLTALVESCLPEEILVAWVRKRNTETDAKGSHTLEHLMTFLRLEVQGEEMAQLAKSGFGTPIRKRDPPTERVKKPSELMTASAFVSSENASGNVSDYDKMIRVFAWILKFVNNCRKDYNKCKKHELSVAEIENSEKQLIRLTQTYYLPDVESLKFVTFIDNDNILRVKSKITERNDKMKSLSSRPSPLPPVSYRVADSAISEVVGIDLAGHLFLKTGEKVWITLFTCAVYHALHLELENALSSDAFFLEKLDWHKISREASTQKVVWKFIPPTAAWWGGCWERLVRIIKELLRRSLGKSILSYEELSTVICECEFLINSRPLTYISENPQELIPLTPAMFLIENRCSDNTDINELNSRELRKRLKYRINFLRDLRQRFRKEYLRELIQKQNNNRVREPQVGEMVLIGNDNKKRLSWPIAKIIELIPGRDGEIRTVQLKT